MTVFTPHKLTGALALVCLGAATPSLAQVTFYEHDGFQGRSFTTQSQVRDLQRRGFNDRASSVVVRSQRWELCEDVNFKGRCRVLRPGQYGSLAAMGFNDRVSSVRAVSRTAPVQEAQYAPPPMVDRDYRRRDRERVYEAPVISVRAIFGEPQQRCWIEREQVREGGGDGRVPGAIFGAVLGGVLGHQIGGGRGRDVATAGGAVAGAVLGANIGRNHDGSTTVSRDVQRCAAAPGSARPAYWDVTYEFRGQPHQVQLMAPPGATITVNGKGEPRT